MEKTKYKKYPFPLKFKNANLDMQFVKIAEEFGELGAENANLLNKIRRGEKIRLEDIKKAVFEAFDVSQAAQTYIYLIGEIFGKHYCIDVDKLVEQKIKINTERGYYDGK